MTSLTIYALEYYLLKITNFLNFFKIFLIQNCFYFLVGLLDIYYFNNELISVGTKNLSMEMNNFLDYKKLEFKLKFTTKSLNLKN